MTEQKPSYCRSCGAHIRWCYTESGKRIPVDWLPDDRGKLVLSKQPDGSFLAVHEANATLVPTPIRYVAHFATCDDPDAWRKRKAAA